MKCTVIVGHRGVGKSSLLKRWQDYYGNEEKFYDLDLEIERFTGKSIDRIFAEEGEASFRNYEKTTFDNILNQDSFSKIISVGGGFDLSLVPDSIDILWIRRDSDKEGRIFLDRPRLELALDALEEFKTRYRTREVKFQKFAKRVYTLPEGLSKKDPEEKHILLESSLKLNAFLTLQARHLKRTCLYQDCQFEIRDDIFNDEQVKDALRIYDERALLYSVRTQKPLPSEVIAKGIKVDWDAKFPLNPSLNPSIISTHENNIHDAIHSLANYENKSLHLKLCPLVETWDDLWTGYQWLKMDSKNRSFLPRSHDGRFAWFRLILKGQQWINFVREDEGSSQDQPTLWEWLSTPEKVQTFAAVLGYPIQHSYSPVYHKDFFSLSKRPFLKIAVESADWKKAISILDKLGLRAAAVTSPLKEAAGAFVNQRALNTLAKTRQGWMGTNTDTHGAYALIASYLDRPMAIWGGGGVLESLKSIIPKAQFYSVRTGSPREESEIIDDPEVVVWAAPDGNLRNVPRTWQPEIILDLNYKQNSEGLRYAQTVKARYVSGLQMFEVQAREQQTFWASLQLQDL